MFLDEHHSKLLFSEAGVPVPHGWLVTPATAAEFRPDGPGPWFAKAQVLAGGRGKAGGILRVDKAEDFPAALDRLFSMRIKGDSVPLVRVEAAAAIEREFYLAFAVARGRKSLVLTVSRSGGVEVEAQDSGDRLVQDIAPAGPAGHQVRAAFFHLGLSREFWPGFQDLAGRLYSAVRDYGLLLAEINPLVLTRDGGWLALDGKAEMDDNVLDLRPDLERFREPAHHTAEENQARAAGLSYVTMPGWVGLAANGAGLAMATMDLLNFNGLPVANFMDFGGAADQERMTTALRLLFGNPRTKAVFLNLFGGILSCEMVARALVATLDGKPPGKPLVARLAGNGAEAGRKLLRGLNLPDLHVTADVASALDALRSLRPGDAETVAFERFQMTDGVKSEHVPSAGMGAYDVPFPLNAESKVLVQGITGRQAQLHTRLMLQYGARIVAGVTPFKGGGDVLGVPVYDSVAQALEEHEIDASIIFVPAGFTADAIQEAAANNIPWTVCITEGVPQQAMLATLERMRGSATRLIGPNTPGLIVPGQTKIGILPDQVFTPGPLAVFSRSGTLTYEAAAVLSAARIGQSVAVGVGGDPFVGVGYKELLDLVRHDQRTRAVLVIGEIGGTAEEELAAYALETDFSKPVLAFIAGQTAPPGKRLGHAGAILDERSKGIKDKLRQLSERGVVLCSDLRSLAGLVQSVL